MILDKFSLENKTALITGAAGLLGKEHAIALLEVGARVILTDVDLIGLERLSNELKKEYSKSVIIEYQLDVTNEQNIVKIKEHLKQKKISLDILINNAALDPKVDDDSNKSLSRLEKFELAQWKDELEVGLTGPFLCSKIFGDYMFGNKTGGVILNISSDLSVFSPDQRIYKVEGLEESLQPVKPITYSVIKSGLIGMTRYLATYWPKSIIRVNAISPGGVFNNHDESFVKKLSSLIPMGRMASKEEYRSAVQFLCSDASSYVNGQNIIIDGGRSVW